MAFIYNGASLEAQLVKSLPASQESTLGWEDPLEKGNATHSSILAWRIPWTVWGCKELDMTERLPLFYPKMVYMPSSNQSFGVVPQWEVLHVYAQHTHS